jgi:hypothetical protein
MTQEVLQTFEPEAVQDSKIPSEVIFGFSKESLAQEERYFFNFHHKGFEDNRWLEEVANGTVPIRWVKGTDFTSGEEEITKDFELAREANEKLNLDLTYAGITHPSEEVRNQVASTLSAKQKNDLRISFGISLNSEQVEPEFTIHVHEALPIYTHLYKKKNHIKQVVKES